jgi:hypothetical protein
MRGAPAIVAPASRRANHRKEYSALVRLPNTVVGPPHLEQKAYRRRMKLVLATLLALSLASAPALGGCGLGELKDGLEHASAVRDEIKREYGTEASVHFEITNGRKTVEVQFASTPPGDAQQIKTRVEAIVRSKFGNVDEVKVSL